VAPTERDRRTVLAGGVGTVVAIVFGGIFLNGYSRRNHLRIRSLSVVNETDEPVSVSVWVGENLAEAEERVLDLEPAGTTGDEGSMLGPWHKRAGEYVVRASVPGHALHLRNADLNEAIDSGWGSDDVAIACTVIPAGRLEVDIEAVE